MKLIIQIPCYDEKETLPQVISDLPHKLPGIDVIEYLVIDDGSSDGSAELASSLGVHHILRLPSNRGLANAFLLGIRKCIDLGADIIVNTDGDNQYNASGINSLIAPIIRGTADIVVGTRSFEGVAECSWLKKKLQHLGSSVVRKFSGTEVADTTSGFRAYSTDAAMRLHVFNHYTYTLETIIQAGVMNMRVCSIPIETNAITRRSRLMSSTTQYIWRSCLIILRTYITYRPFRTFLYLSLIPGLIGLIICLRFLYYFFAYPHSGHIQSLVLAAVLLLIAFHLLALGILADVISTNRKLIHEVLYFVQKRKLSQMKTQ